MTAMRKNWISLAKRTGLSGLLVLGLSLALGSGSTSHAQDRMQVGTPMAHVLATDWGLTLKSDGTGFYNDLARLTIMAADPGANYEIQPYRRAKARFFRENTGCLYPSNIDLLQDGHEVEGPDGLIESAAILRVRVFLFSQPGTKAPATLTDVNDRTVAYAMGSRVPYFLAPARADYIAVTDEVAKAQMLLSGRVDLMSAAMPDLKFVMDKLGVQLPPYDASFPLNDTKVKVVCHDTPDNRAFIDDVNARMTAILKDGTLAAFLKDQGLDADLYLPAAD